MIKGANRQNCPAVEEKEPAVQLWLNNDRPSPWEDESKAQLAKCTGFAYFR